MQTLVQYALIGLGVGSLYSLASQGLLVVYRGSGILNFANGGIGMVGAFVWWDLHYQHGHSFLLSMVIGVLLSALVGAATHLLVMRPLRHAAPLVRLVATLGVLITLQAIAILRYGTNTQVISDELPTNQLHLWGSVFVSADRLILLGTAAVLTAALWALYRFTRFGVGTSAVAESERSAAALGWSPDRIATINWALGSAITGVAAILIAPIVQLQVSTMTTLAIASMSAALVANFRSFPVAFAAGMSIGIGQTVIQGYVPTSGVSSSLPFAVIVLMLLFRGRALPVRGYFLQKLPAVGTGRVRPVGVGAGLVIGIGAIAIASPAWLDAIAVTLGAAMVLLSIVVLTGYAGQISLAQFAIAGFGAWVAGRLAATQGVPFVPAALIAVVATVPIGVLMAVPAARVRGVTLAVLTLGLGTALELLIFNSPNLTGGYTGTNLPPTKLLGWPIDSARHPARYALVCLAAFTLACLAVANLRRGRTGRRLLAVRTDESAATALGINVVSAKLYAFGVAAALAALGGVLLSFKGTSIVYTDFSSFQSISYVGYAVVGGLGYAIGPVLGAVIVPGAIASALANELFESIAQYIPLIGGVAMVLMVLGNQNGLAHAHAGQLRWIAERLGRRSRRADEDEPAPELEFAVTEAERVAARTLQVRDVVVRYGGVTAVDGLSITVRPGEIIGLIGPNGAGKTSAIDAITGFTAPASGQVLLDDEDITRTAPYRRARMGISRSFQGLHLFEDMTVLDNLRTASDPRNISSGLTDLVYPKSPPMPAGVADAIEVFGLRGLLNRRVGDLAHGQRRLVSIARAVATRPSVLLLDEPAAGLGDVESQELATLVNRLPRELGMGILLVEHDMRFVMSTCTDIVVLDFGKPIFSGTPAEVRGDALVVGAYLGVDADDLHQIEEPSLVNHEAGRVQ